MGARKKPVQTEIENPGMKPKVSHGTLEALVQGLYVKGSSARVIALAAMLESPKSVDIDTMRSFSRGGMKMTGLEVSEGLLEIKVLSQQGKLPGFTVTPRSVVYVSPEEGDQ